MDIMQRGIITLLKSAITEQSLPLPENFSMEQAEEIITKQSLYTLTYQGAYLCGVDLNSKVMLRHRSMYLRELIRSEKQMGTVKQIFRAFDENGIDYLPLKGCVLKKLYPQQELRIMGDADILIKAEQYEQIQTIMKDIGCTEDVKSDYDIHWVGQNLLVELHYRLFGEKQDDLCLYFNEPWKMAILGAGHQHHFGEEDTFVYVFAHMAKHFRHCGIGARQIVDLYVYRRAHPQMDERQVEAIMKKIHLLDFYRNIKRLLMVWFEDEPSDEVTDTITEYVFSAGNWGTTKNKMYSEAVLRAKEAGGAEKTKARAIWDILFPPLWYLQLSYNYLYKRPWMYPFYWPIRWVDILLNRRGNIRKRMNVIHDISDESVESHRQFLQYMGLGYYSTGTDQQ